MVINQLIYKARNTYLSGLKKTLLVILLSFLQTVLAANTYYIDSINGSNSNTGQSIDWAFANHEALNNVQINAGDSILFAANTTYSGYFDINFSGQANAPIYISSYGDGNKPVFSNPGEWFIIRIKGMHIIIDGFEFHSSTYTAIEIDGKNNTVQNCFMHNVPFGISLKNSGMYIYKNTFENLIMNRNTEGGDDDNGAVGIVILHGGSEIAYNTFINCKAESYDYGIDGGALEFYGDINGMKIHHNLAKHCDGFFECGGGTIEDVEIYYNVLINNGEIGGFHFHGNFGATVRNFSITNNTIFDDVPDQTEVLWFNGDPETQQISFINNIVYYNGFNYFTSKYDFIHENNIYYSPGGDLLGFSLHESELNTDPLFVSIEDSVYLPIENSPAINAGQTHNYPSDYFNKAIVGKPDIGAYESDIVNINNTKKMGISVWPNPTSRTLFFKNSRWEIYNSYGVKIAAGKSDNADISSYANGLYFIKSGNKVSPFIKN